MLRLADALAGWTPAAGDRSHDPVALLEAGWREIVGDDVAQNSRPARIVDGTLSVTTRSSAWSHQLSFLSEHVLRAVNARLPSAGISRLRFSIGTISQRHGFAARRGKTKAAVRAKRPERGTAPSLGETLARFRSDIEGRRHERRSEGWLECERCGALVSPESGRRCASCVAAHDEAIAAITARLLYDAPWLGYAGTAELVNGLQEGEYERIRSRLLAHWWRILARARATKQLGRDGRERLIASSYVLLQSRLAPEAIMPATVRNILGDELHDLLYG